jgi:hypothetical protein
MESGSQGDHPAQGTSQGFASFIGAVIALLTLSVPLMMIAYFSSGAGRTLPPPAQVSSTQVVK